MDYRIRWQQRRLERRRQRLAVLPIGLALGLALYFLLRGGGGPTVLWTYQGPSQYAPHFAVTRAELYALYPDGHLHNLRLIDGEPARDAPVLSQPEPFSGDPAMAQGVLYFGSDLGRVRAVYARTGDVLWVFQARGAVRAAPLVDGQRVYVADDAGRVTCLNAADGKPAWSRDLGSPVSAGIALASGVVVAGTREGLAMGLAPGSGAVLWQKPLGEPLFAPVTAADPLVAFGGDMGTCFLLDAVTGKLTQSYRTRGLMRSPAAVTDHGLAFGSSDGWLRVVSRDGMQPLWAFDLHGPIVAGPVAAGGLIYAASPDLLVALDQQSGRRLRAWRHGPYGGSLVATVGTVYAGTSDGRIVALSLPQGP